MMILALSTGLILSMSTLAGADQTDPSPARQTIKTRVPQAHVDAYMNSCSATSPRASCWCMVEKMNATADGQFVLDMLGLNNVDSSKAKAEVLAMLNRHGFRATQGKAVVDRSEAMIEAAAKNCT